MVLQFFVLPLAYNNYEYKKSYKALSSMSNTNSKTRLTATLQKQININTQPVKIERISEQNKTASFQHYLPFEEQSEKDTVL